jgi:hypothetical protein
MAQNRMTHQALINQLQGAEHGRLATRPRTRHAATDRRRCGDADRRRPSRALSRLVPRIATGTGIGSWTPARDALSCRSRSCVARKTEALLRISSALRSSRFSRSGCCGRSRPLVLSTARCPASISARFTHTYNVTWCIPNFPAIDFVACHSDVYSPWVLLDHPHRSLPQLLGISALLAHCSLLLA